MLHQGSYRALLPLISCSSTLSSTPPPGLSSFYHKVRISHFPGQNAYRIKFKHFTIVIYKQGPPCSGLKPHSQDHPFSIFLYLPMDYLPFLGPDLYFHGRNFSLDSHSLPVQMPFIYHFIPTTMDMIKKTLSNKCWCGCGETATFVHC